ncbi:MAG: hypothetical protein GXP55_24165 [Deltaproteobacteria bacterium]|nr:hypothetical protein [Deltaproteobacteria bacterium]
MVFDLGARGRRLGAAVVQAVAALVDEAPLDVWLSLEDVPGDALDATELVARVRTLGAVPAEGAVDEGDAYSDVRPGTRLRFSLLLDADALVSAERPTRVPLDVVLRTEAGARLDSRRVEIVIPARDGRGCGFLGADATAL